MSKLNSLLGDDLILYLIQKCYSKYKFSKFPPYPFELVWNLISPLINESTKSTQIFDTCSLNCALN